jgi:hypothetical protein
MRFKNKIYTITMSNFPLYQQLSKKIPKKVLTGKQKSEFILNVGNMDNSGIELILVLIRVHQIVNSTELIDMNIPYSGYFEDGGMTFDFEKLPPDLCHILYKFSIKHLESNMETEAHKAGAEKILAKVRKNK